MAEDSLLVKTVDFEGDQLKIAQNKENKKIYVGIKWVCRGLKFTPDQSRRQVRNVQNDLVLKQGCVKLGTGVFDDNNETTSIELDFLPLWLAKISITPRMKSKNPLIVQKLVNYQLKAKDVLARAFIDKSDQTTDNLEFLQGMLNVLKDQQNEIEDTKNKVVQIKHYLADTPDRKKLEREVSAFARRTNTPHAHVWKMLYDKIEDKYGIDIPIRVQHKHESINDKRVRSGKKPYKTLTLQNKYNGMTFLAENNMFQDAMEILAGMYDEHKEIN